eukprot:9474526-Pyramimonas_sp.AAC.1
MTFACECRRWRKTMVGCNVHVYGIDTGPELSASMLREPEGEEAKDASSSFHPHVGVAGNVKLSVEATF